MCFKIDSYDVDSISNFYVKQFKMQWYIKMVQVQFNGFSVKDFVAEEF